MKRTNLFILIFLMAATSFLTSCLGEKRINQDVQYADEGSIPYRIAILPPAYVPSDGNGTTVKSVIMDDDRLFVANIARGALRNQLSGKGYQPVQFKVVDNKLAGLGRDDGWRIKSDEELCRLLDVDGIVRIDIYAADMIKAVAFDLFKLDAEVKIINSEGKNVGSWRESASKRRVSVPTGILSLAGTLVEQVFADPISRQMRMVVYEWAWNLSQSLPDSPAGNKLPEVISVDTNVDNHIFGIGRKIFVKVDGEKELSCSFSIGDFRKGIKLPQTSPGVYEGFYVVKEGDKAANEALSVRMRKPNGVERIWLESGALLTIDGTPPPVPVSVVCTAGRDGIDLSWQTPDGESLKEFVIERGENPVGKFEIIGRTRELEFTDPQSPQGRTLYYRVRSVDNAGNFSKEEKAIAVTVPQFDIRELTEPLSGKLVRGNYAVNSPLEIKSDQNFEVGSGTSITFGKAGYLRVYGQLAIQGNIESPVIMSSDNGTGIIASSGGQVRLSNSVFNNFSKAVVGNGGYLSINSCEFRSNGTSAVNINGNGAFDLQGLRISGFKSGVVIKSGLGKLVRSYISNCTTGVDYFGGQVSIQENNIYGNKLNVNAADKLVLEDNYLGSSSNSDLGVSGDVFVHSILDAPYPHGRKIVLVDETVMTPEVKEKRFESAKGKGEKAFHEQRYGDSYRALNEALEYGEDRDVYLYLSYTLLALGENEKLEHVLKDGISKFPYDVRLQNTYVRYLMGKGKIGQARAVLEKAIKLSPADQNLISMKEYLDQAAESVPQNKETESDLDKKIESENAGAFVKKNTGVLSKSRSDADVLINEGKSPQHGSDAEKAQETGVTDDN